MTTTTVPPVAELDDGETIKALEKAVSDAGRTPSAAARAPAAGASPSTASLWQQAGPYLGYVGYFVGAGLISGGIVHYTLDPARYALFAAAGVAVFLLATVCNEVLLPAATLPRTQLVRVVSGSLVLSLGIGMLSGGIQHFSDFPARSAVLVPLGLALSFVAFHVRSATVDVRSAVLSYAGVVVLTLVVGLAIGLDLLADRLTSDETGSGHEHGAATTSAEVPTAPQSAEVAPVAEDGDAHAH